MKPSQYEGLVGWIFVAIAMDAALANHPGVSWFWTGLALLQFFTAWRMNRAERWLP